MLLKANYRYNVNHIVSESKRLHLNMIMMIGLTTIEALNSFCLVAIFYALYDITVAAKSSVMSDWRLR